jgi:hypothetical protein
MKNIDEGAALRGAMSSSAAARALYAKPGGPDASPRSPTIGTGAPAVYSPSDEVGAPRRRRPPPSEPSAPRE